MIYNIKKQKYIKRQKRDMRKEEMDNLNKILDIAREEYNNYFQRIQTLDVKIGLLTAFYGIIYINVIDATKLNQFFIDIIVNKNITLLNILGLHINVLSILLFLVTMILLIYDLISKDTRFVPISIFNNKVTRYTEKQLTINLIEKTYKESIYFNNVALDTKHKIFNISCILLSVNLVMVIFAETIKIGGA